MRKLIMALLVITLLGVVAYSQRARIAERMSWSWA